MPPGFPALVRPAGLARAAHPGSVPEPQHHHLPAWVRRAHAQARPILADLLGALSGEPRDRLEASLADLTAQVSAGKFTQSFRYADLIREGDQALTEQRREQAAAAREQRLLETARRRVAADLQDAAGQLPQEAASRLNRALRSAESEEAIRAVAQELGEATQSARSIAQRRRDREIDRTRSRIQRSSPRSPAAEPGADWQEVLRRLQEEMTAGSASG